MDGHSSKSSAAVLVVEDEPLVRNYVTDILGQSGFDVIEASTGEEAQARIAQGGVCAVVSDVAMPGRMNGFELARWVRQQSPRTGIVLVSGVMEPSKAHLPSGSCARSPTRARGFRFPAANLCFKLNFTAGVRVMSFISRR